MNDHPEMGSSYGRLLVGGDGRALGGGVAGEGLQDVVVGGKQDVAWVFAFRRAGSVMSNKWGANAAHRTKEGLKSAGWGGKGGTTG